MTHQSTDVSGPCGSAVLTNRYLNRGTAFTIEERKQLHILGQLPTVVETLEQQVKRAYNQMKSCGKPIDQYQQLAALHATNTTLYYATIFAHLEETLPIIYTPTVGEACQRYSSLLFRERGLYLCRTYKGMFRTIMRDSGYENPKVVVITDGSRILGLGDLGANGVGISIGKCSLYVAGAGINPKNVVPVVLDAGTDNAAMLSDDNYIGVREKRPSDEDFYALLDEFMEAASEAWPEAVIQFEDFSNNHCFDMLERYQNKYRCFNDDIQGTGAVIAAGFLNAIEASGIPAEDHRIVFFGAGSAATGVATCIVDLVAAKYKKTFAEVQNNVYLLDTKGVITTTRGDKLAPHKVPWARTDISAEQSKSLSTLVDAVKFVKPTALIGLGAQGGVFTEDILKFMRSYCEKPVIFALSNPSSKVEVTPDNAFKWTDGKAIVATGSPFPPTTLNGKKYEASQGNNLYVFPGIGLGCAIAQPKNIPQEVLQTAAVTLSKLVDRNVMASEGALYPCIDEVREVSKQVAAAVIEKLQEMGLAKEGLPTSKEERLKLVEERMWTPKYLEPEYYLSKKLE